MKHLTFEGFFAEVGFNTAEEEWRIGASLASGKPNQTNNKNKLEESPSIRGHDMCIWIIKDYF